MTEHDTTQDQAVTDDTGHTRHDTSTDDPPTAGKHAAAEDHAANNRDNEPPG